MIRKIATSYARIAQNMLRSEPTFRPYVGTRAGRLPIIGEVLATGHLHIQRGLPPMTERFAAKNTSIDDTVTDAVRSAVKRTIILTAFGAWICIITLAPKFLMGLFAALNLASCTLLLLSSLPLAVRRIRSFRHRRAITAE